MRDAPAMQKEMAALELLALERAQALSEARRQLLQAATPVLTVLFARYLVHDVQAPEWPARDRFVASGGFGPAIDALRQLLGRDGNGNAGGEEEHAQAAPRMDGPDLPLRMPGHGLAAAVGMALAARRLREEFGEGFDVGTYALIDDLDVEPGIAQEAIAIAPHLLPHRLTVLHLTPLRRDDEEEGRRRCPNHLARFAAAGWHVQQVRADDIAGIEKALEQAAEQDVADWQERRPAYIAVEYEPMPVSDPQIRRAELGWQELAAGEVPEEVRDAWRLTGLRGRKAHKAWVRWLEELDETRRARLQRRLEGAPPEGFAETLRGVRRALAEEAASRDLQALALGLMRHALDRREDMLALAAGHGGLPRPAALPGKEAGGVVPGLTDIGLRPAALTALLAGVAAQGGFLPVGVAQRRYLPLMAPVLKEAADAGLRLVLLLLDGQECALPAQALLPDGVDCLCPADAVELAECWQVALLRSDGPAVIVVPSGEAPALRTTPEKSNLAALGAYEIHVSEDAPQGVIFAMGAPLAAAVRAARRLETEAIGMRVVSIPAPERLLRQPAEHVERIVGTEALRLLLMRPPAPVACEVLRQGGQFVEPCDEEGRWLSEEALTAAVVRRVREALDAQRTEPTTEESDGEE